MQCSSSDCANYFIGYAEAPLVGTNCYWHEQADKKNIQVDIADFSINSTFSFSVIFGNRGTASAGSYFVSPATADVGTWPIFMGSDEYAATRNARVMKSLCIQVRPRLTRSSSDSSISVLWQLHSMGGPGTFGCDAAAGWAATPVYQSFQGSVSNSSSKSKLNVSLEIRSWQDPYILGQLRRRADSADTLSGDDFNILGGCLIVVALVMCIQPASVARILHQKHMDEITPPTASRGWTSSRSADSQDFDSAGPSFRQASVNEEDLGSSTRMDYTLEQLAYARVRAVEGRGAPS